MSLILWVAFKVSFFDTVNSIFLLLFKVSFFYRQGYYDGYYDYYPQLSYAQRVKSVENKISGRLLGGLRGTLNNARKVSSRYVCLRTTS